MYIFNNINSLHNTYTAKIQSKNNSQVINSVNLSCDKFEHTNPIIQTYQAYPINAISFTSNVSNGAFLRNLTGVHDPYSGVVILNNKELNQFYQTLAKKNTGKEKLRFLDAYTESMFPVEKETFYMMKEELKQNDQLSMQKILQLKQPKALKNLIKEQKQVFNQMSNIAENLSESNKLKVQDTIEKAKKQILLPYENKNHFKKGKFENQLMRIAQNQVFIKLEQEIDKLPINEKNEALEKLYNVKDIFDKTAYYTNINGKTPLKMLHELQSEYCPESLKEPNEMQPILELAQKLPTKKDNINAFIVEMADKDDSTIAKKLVSESLGTIEHIVPDSKGGENLADNFLFVTKARNEERGNKSIKKFKTMYPDIPKYCQQYINDVIKNCEDGKLRGFEWYPFVIKDTIKTEIGANVAIKSYRVSPQKAFRTFPNALKDKYPQYSKYFTKPQ